MSICSFCNGTKVEPGHDKCVWCECADIQPIGDRAIEVVTDPAKLTEMISRLMEVNNRLLQVNQSLQERLNTAEQELDDIRSQGVINGTLRA